MPGNCFVRIDNTNWDAVACVRESLSCLNQRNGITATPPRPPGGIFILSFFLGHTTCRAASRPILFFGSIWRRKGECVILRRLGESLWRLLFGAPRNYSPLVRLDISTTLFGARSIGSLYWSARLTSDCGNSCTKRLRNWKPKFTGWKLCLTTCTCLWSPTLDWLPRISRRSSKDSHRTNCEVNSLGSGRNCPACGVEAITSAALAPFRNPA